MYRTCEDCTFNDGVCMLGHDKIFEKKYKQNQCEDGNGNIFLS